MCHGSSQRQSLGGRLCAVRCAASPASLPCIPDFPSRLASFAEVLQRVACRIQPEFLWQEAALSHVSPRPASAQGPSSLYRWEGGGETCHMCPLSPTPQRRQKSKKVPTGGQPYLLHLRKREEVPVHKPRSAPNPSWFGPQEESHGTTGRARIWRVAFGQRPVCRQKP